MYSNNKPTQPPAEEPKRVTWKALFFILIGLAIFAAPPVLKYYNSRIQYDVISKYNEEVTSLDQQKIDRQIELAREFNRQLAGGVAERIDPFSAAGKQLTEAAMDKGYPEAFQPNEVIGELEIPKLDIKFPIYNGTTDEILMKGIGYLPNTSLPVGGDTVHTVLTGHRGQQSAEFFRFIDQLEEGDVFYVSSLGQTLAYEVDQKKIIEPHQVNELMIVPEKDYTTLLTCEPYMINSHRLLVRGHQIPYEKPTVTGTQTTEHVKLTYIRYKEYIFGAIFLLVFLILTILIKRYLNRRKQA